jgi:hypothetical protein
MLRYLSAGAILLVVGCAAPTAPAPATSATAVITPAATATVPMLVARPPGTVVGVSPDGPPGGEPAAPVGAAPGPPGPGASDAPASATEAPALAGTGVPSGELSPARPTPTAVSIESLSRSADIEALAGAPERPTAGAGPGAGPTAAVLPPSARVLAGPTPTAVVVASSPVLAPAAAVAPSTVDFARAIKAVQDSRKGGAAPRLEDRVETSVAQTRAAGGELEILGWQAALKGAADVYQVTYTVRLNRQGMRAEWEVNLATGEVRPVNQLAEALDG